MVFIFFLLHFFFFFFNDTATTEIYTLSLHDALPIWTPGCGESPASWRSAPCRRSARSEEHTSELQSRRDLVCRLLLEKKNKVAGLVGAAVAAMPGVVAMTARGPS